MGMAGSDCIMRTRAGRTTIADETPAAVSPSVVRLVATMPPANGPAPATKCSKPNSGTTTAASSSTATSMPESAMMTDRHCLSSVGSGMSEPMWKRIGATRIV